MISVATHCWQVTYMDKRGAGCVRTFGDESSLLTFIRNLKYEARILRDGEEIGKVWKESGIADDRRVKWLWCFESYETRDGWQSTDGSL